MTPKFQFTPLREGRLYVPHGSRSIFYISIHAPARGATYGLSPFRDAVGNFNSRPCERGDALACRNFSISIPISIHAPARGATPKSGECKADFWVYFNSRPCERGDVQESTHSASGLGFQFTPLREGRHCSWSVHVLFPVISIHAPARGATAKLNKISVKFTEIIIKTEWEFKQYSSYGY